MIYLIRLRPPERRRRIISLPALGPPPRPVRLQKVERPTRPAALPDGRGEPAAVNPDEPRGAALVPVKPDEPPRDTPAGASAAGRGETADKRDELREKALQASYDEYKEQVAAWRNLDTKAQGNITVAGIFIAGAFTYLSKFALSGFFEAGLLLLALIFLVGCVLLSLGVLRVRSVPPHHLGYYMRTMVEDLKGKTDDDFRAFLPLFYKRHADLWHESSETFGTENERKGKHLWAAQVFLIASILSVALLVAFKIFTFKSLTPG